MAALEDNTHACLIKMSSPERYGILATRGNGFWMVQGFKSKDEGIKYFEDLYREYTGRDATWTTSVLLCWTTFQPSIVPLPEKVLYDIVEKEVVLRIRSSSGVIVVFPAHLEKARGLWDSGDKPSLIYEDKNGKEEKNRSV